MCLWQNHSWRWLLRRGMQAVQSGGVQQHHPVHHGHHQGNGPVKDRFWRCCASGELPTFSLHRSWLSKSHILIRDCHGNKFTMTATSVFTARTMPVSCLLWQVRQRTEWCRLSWLQWFVGCGTMVEFRRASIDHESISSTTLLHSEDSLLYIHTHTGLLSTNYQLIEQVNVQITAVFAGWLWRKFAEKWRNGISFLELCFDKCVLKIRTVLCLSPWNGPFISAEGADLLSL